MFANQPLLGTFILYAATIMATASNPAPMEQIIIVKINYQGVTRRAKMALRDMAPHALESQVSSKAPYPIFPF